MLERLQEALRDADERDMVYECVDTLRSMMPDLIECAEALGSCADWLDWLDDPRGGLGDMHKAHIKLARKALAKLEQVK